eukprot:Lithocolla_globosa_v1_NODE_4145_length_1501_cov_444.529046.p1 type:complete len:216 gc:universal NODE_4145_length_1501_cov_444.529046:778-131(-)
MFERLYSTCFLVAKKHSGKTSTIYNILRKKADKRSKVVVFCSTCENDDNWLAMRDYLDKKNIPNEFYTSIHENNALENLVEEMKHDSISDDDSEEDVEPPVLVFGTESIQVKRKKQKPKLISPRFIVIFDDISSDLRNKQIAQLLKIHRHLKSFVILSSQWLNDVEPSSFRQMNYILVFQGMSVQKLEELYSKADLSITFNRFLELYRDSTKDKI